MLLNRHKTFFADSHSFADNAHTVCTLKHVLSDNSQYAFQANTKTFGPEELVNAQERYFSRWWQDEAILSIDERLL